MALQLSIILTQSGRSLPTALVVLGGGAPMFFRSLFWERTVLSLLEKVQELPLNVRADIVKRVGGYIAIASTTHEAGSLERFAAAAVEEQGKVIAQGIKSTLDQRWAASAFAGCPASAEDLKCLLRGRRE